MIPVTTFANKTVAVFGLGASGNATALALMAGGAAVAAWDDGAAGRAGAEKAGIPLVDLSTADWSQFAALILAPGVALTHPEPHWTVQKAKAAGIEVIGDIELFCRERNAHAPDAPFIAITGTNGKSTTTALIAHILREAGKDVQMGGNIGVPILALEPPAGALGLAPEPQDQKLRFHVIEMSSFQIDLTPNVNPTVGVLLNITPDHLDRHGTMENYANLKYRLTILSDVKVWGMPAFKTLLELQPMDGLSLELKAIYADWGVERISYVGNSRDTVILIRGSILQKTNSTHVLCDLDGVTTLRGAHNSENAAAAFAALDGILDDATIARHIRTYPGLPHRMEEIGRVGSTLFINDSKATNADSTEKALLSFPRDVFWIVGGKAKEGGIEPLRRYFPGIVRAYLIGASSDAFAQTLDGDAAIIPCGTLEVAVARASADAAASGLAAPVVLLSPACASYDQFRSFEHRGDTFRDLVKALPGFKPRGT
jgi:UDP-N-acetylmuramoylalanine--D-glutamate ligase